MTRILLAEDDEIMRITLFDRLTGLGFDVDQEENGKDALARIKENYYQLIISDIKMPGLDGISLLKETLKVSPETDVILMTAYGNVEDAVECLRKGATDYLLKPFDMDDLTYVPVATVMRMFNQDELMEIDVVFSHEDATDHVVAGIRSVLMERHGGHEDFTILTQAAMLEDLYAFFQNLVTACDPQIDDPFCDQHGNVGGVRKDDSRTGVGTHRKESAPGHTKLETGAFEGR